MPAGWTGTSPPGPWPPTCARPTPIARWRPGSSPTVRPASTSAPPTARSGMWCWPRSPPSGFSRPGTATGSGSWSPAATRLTRIPARNGRVAAPRRPLGPLRRTPHASEARAPTPTWPPPWPALENEPSAGGARSSWCPTSLTPPTGRSPYAAWHCAIRSIAAHVTDPRELSFPAVGILGVVDPETGRRHPRADQLGRPAPPLRGRRRGPPRTDPQGRSPRQEPTISTCPPTATG